MYIYIYGHTYYYFPVMKVFGFFCMNYSKRAVNQNNSDNYNSNNNSNDNEYNDNDNNSNKDNSNNTDDSNPPKPSHEVLGEIQNCNRLRIV